MNRFILFFLYLFCSIAEITAQTIYEKVDTSSYVFNYIPYQRSANNKVLNQLALAHLKIPEKAKIIYSFRYRTSINYSQNDSLYIFLDVSTIKISGDNKIRDYDIASLLQPADFRITYSLETPTNGVVLERNLRVNMDEEIAMIGSFPDSLWQDGIRLNLAFDDINFSEHNYRQLELELAAIRDYYASGSLNDTLYKQVQKARKNTVLLKDAGKVYITGLKGLYLLNQSFDNTSKIVPGNDPLNNRERNRILRYNFQEYTDYIINRKSPLLIGNPYIALSNGYIESVIAANKISQQVDYYSSPFFYKLYANTVFASQFLQAKKIINQTATGRVLSSPDFRILTTEILRRYLIESNKLLQEKRYAEAIDLLSGARKFMNFNPNGGANLAVESKLAEARKGLIFSYTEIIQKSLDKNLFTLASNYLVEVEKFIEKYDISNHESGPFKEVYIRMADIHVQLGNNALALNDFNKALIEFTTSLEFLNGNSSNVKAKAENGLSIAVRTLYNNELSVVYGLINNGDHAAAELQLIKAKRFAEGFPSFYPDKAQIDSLNFQIASLKYEQLVNSFPENLTIVNKNHINKLIEAIDLRSKFNIIDTVRLDTLIYSLGMPWVSDLFSKGNLKYWASETDSALYYANYAMNTAELLGLNREPIIIQQHEKLNSLAGETYCNKAKGEYNSLINQIEKYFRDNKFSEGLILSEKARELAYSKATCGLKTALINDLLERYKYPLRWNAMVNEAFSMLNEKRYRESADLIQQAEALFSYYHLDSLKIANVGYFDLANKSNDHGLIRHAVGYMLNKQQPDKAFVLLDKLRTEGVLPLEASDLQEAVARNLGTRDIKETPDLNVKVMLESYTRDDKWFAKFETVYRYYTKSSTQPFINKKLDKITDDLKDLF